MSSGVPYIVATMKDLRYLSWIYNNTISIPSLSSMLKKIFTVFELVVNIYTWFTALSNFFLPLRLRIAEIQSICYISLFLSRSINSTRSNLCLMLRILICFIIKLSKFLARISDCEVNECQLQLVPDCGWGYHKKQWSSPSEIQLIHLNDLRNVENYGHYILWFNLNVSNICIHYKNTVVSVTIQNYYFFTICF